MIDLPNALRSRHQYDSSEVISNLSARALLEARNRDDGDVQPTSDERLRDRPIRDEPEAKAENALFELAEMRPQRRPVRQHDRPQSTSFVLAPVSTAIHHQLVPTPQSIRRTSEPDEHRGHMPDVSGASLNVSPMPVHRSEAMARASSSSSLAVSRSSAPHIRQRRMTAAGCGFIPFMVFAKILFASASIVPRIVPNLYHNRRTGANANQVTVFVR